MVEFDIEVVKDRKDVKLFRATLSNGSTIDIEADDLNDAEDKVTEYLGQVDGVPILEDIAKEQEES